MSSELLSPTLDSESSTLCGVRPFLSVIFVCELVEHSFSSERDINDPVAETPAQLSSTELGTIVYPTASPTLTVPRHDSPL